VRYRLMASYQGAPYQAGIGPAASDVTLFAACPPPEEHGFTSAAGHWRKQVRIDEIEALWESRPTGTYHRDPCLVLDDLGDRLHIAYLGSDDARASQLGYWQVDRGVFEVVIPRGEVRDLTEERHEFPISVLMAALAPLGLPAVEPPALSPAPMPGPQLVSIAPPAMGPSSGPQPVLGAPPVMATPATLATPNMPPAASLGEPPLPVRPPAASAHAPGAASAPFISGPLPAADSAPPVPAAPVPPLAAAWHGSPEDDETWYSPARWNGAPTASGPRDAAGPTFYDVGSLSQNGSNLLNGSGRASGSDGYVNGSARHGPFIDPEPTLIETSFAPAPVASPPAQEVPEAQPAAQFPAVPPTVTAPQPAVPAVPVQPPAPPQAPAPVDPESPARGESPSRADGPAHADQSPAGPHLDLHHSGAVVRGRRAARKPRVATASVFAELLDQANIPRASYAVDEEVSGAMCLLKTGGGFEVFSCANDARHEVRFFEDEEAAYFYLFGVLAAEAMRSGRLGPK
jgi:hypothetical protein